MRRSSPWLVWIILLWRRQKPSADIFRLESELENGLESYETCDWLLSLFPSVFRESWESGSLGSLGSPGVSNCKLYLCRMMYGWVLQSKQSKAKVAQGTSFVSSVLCELFTLSFAKKIRNDNGLTTLYVDCWCYNVISFGDSHISLPQPLGIQSFGQELAGIGGWLYRLCTFDPTVSSPNISRTTTLLQMA